MGTRVNNVLAGLLVVVVDPARGAVTVLTRNIGGGGARGGVLRVVVRRGFVVTGERRKENV